MDRADIERNLLFGLLAVQTGLINRSALAQGFRVWASDKSQSLPAILADQGALPESQREILEALVGVHIEAHEGDVTKSLGAVEAGKSTLETLAAVEDPDLDATMPFVGSGSTQPSPTERTQAFDVGSSDTASERFRILRPHARGGLGAVFVALDSELNREVALKQILDRHADNPASRQRFLLEAEITGGLEHPGIVPVYGLGTFRDGRPYYAMRFIRGDSLKDAIARYHRRARSGESRELELRKLLRRFLDVCNAIEYAHQRGVLHRDLKPGNVMVGKYGETLVVDWGLAKAVGRAETGATEGEPTITPSHSSGSVETLPGAAIGTPSYMCPEQASGQLELLGPRSDVYSLGATLYCLLTGRPPYEGPDAGAVIRAVQAGELSPPRKRVPSIDRPLDAICLKAMAYRPEDRYPSPKALADEVERWMADEPVEAFREPVGRRLSRWARRHSSLVTGGGVALIATVLGLGMVAWLIARQNLRLELARLEVERHADRAEAGSSMARKAVKSMLQEVSRDDLLNVPQAEPLRVILAERAVEFYQQFVKLKPGDPAFGLEHASFEEEVASLYRMTGQFDRARVEYDRSIAILNDLVARDPRSPAPQNSLAYTEDQLAEMIKMAGGSDADAEPHYREAVRLADRLHTDHPAEPKYAKMFAITANDLAIMLKNAGRYDEAEPILGKSLEAAEAFNASLAPKPNPKNFELVRIVLPMVQVSRGSTLTRLGRVRDAMAGLRPAVDGLRSLHATYPESNDFQYHLAQALQELGDAEAVDPNLLGEALKALDEAVELVTPLLEKFPKNAYYPKYLVYLRADRGTIRISAQQFKPAGEDLGFADAKLTESLQTEKAPHDSLRQHGKVKAALARLADREDRREQARSLAQEAIDLQTKALSLDPSNRVDRSLLEQHQALKQELEGRIR